MKRRQKGEEKKMERAKGQKGRGANGQGEDTKVLEGCIDNLGDLLRSQARREGKVSSCRGNVAKGVKGGRGTIKVNGNNETNHLLTAIKVPR